MDKLFDKTWKDRIKKFNNIEFITHNPKIVQDYQNNKQENQSYIEWLELQYLEYQTLLDSIKLEENLNKLKEKDKQKSLNKINLSDQY